MAISIKSNPDGLSGAIQVNGVDVIGISTSGVSSGIPSSGVSVTPVGGISATNVQAALAELDSEKQVALVSGTNIKTVGGNSLLGSGDVPFPTPLTAPFSAGFSLITTSGNTFTVPAGVSSIRAYVFGKGGNGSNSGGGGGGSCTWGTIPVVSGEVFNFTVAGTVAKLVKGAVDYLTANAGVDATGSVPYYGVGGAIGSVGAGLGITDSGSSAGGNGNSGGGASGSPLGIGGAGGGTGGGGGWGGAGGLGGGGAGAPDPNNNWSWPAGGAGPTATGDISRGRDYSNAYTDPLLRPCVSPGGTGASGPASHAQSGGPGGGGGACYNNNGSGARGGAGGLGGGGGAAAAAAGGTSIGGPGGFGGGGGGGGGMAVGGNGGIGGGGGCGQSAPGTGGSAAVLIFY